MTWSVFSPDAARLEELGFDGVSGCSTLFHTDKGYGRVPNRYLRDRITGRWKPTFEAGPSNTSEDPLAPSSSKGSAHKLANFLNYVEASGLKLETLTYEDILNYQRSMARGRWSVSGRRLKPPTCNQRATEATFHMMWLADYGHRPPFDVPTKTIRFAGPTKKNGALILTRTGQLPQGEHTLADLVLPQKKEAFAWLSAVKKRLGKAKMYACRYIMETGARLFETCALRVEQWPSAAAIAAARRAGRSYATMTLTVTKRSKPRTIQLDLEFAALVRDWIERERSRLVPHQLIDNGPLFVSDARGHEGTPLSRATVYRCFKLKTPGGPDRWHPHLGRHYFACRFVLNGLARDAEIAGRTLPSMRPDWVTNRASFWLGTLRLQLGHISDTTTEIYLRWLVTACQLVDVASEWAEFLEGGEPSK